MTTATMDGNTAAAHVAYRVNEVCAIYPITPSSVMAELADAWASQGVPNLWGNVPVVQQMQSEGGAAGTVHGALQSGALTTTFTASQGFLLMLPNMYKIAGELTPTVFHVAARSVATQALSIFGDHSDVMSARMIGFAMLGSASVQEAHDFALIAQAATLASRIPFVHFFDGFRTSHEENKIEVLSDAQIRAMIDDEHVRFHRERALSPEHPVVRGTAHNPDTFFQARETANPFYAKVPAAVQEAMDRFAAIAGRRYRLFEYEGHAEAERVVFAIGSSTDVLGETAAYLAARGEKVGVVKVRLYRPWSEEHLLAALPKTVRSIAVLDRTKEPGGPGEPLYLDVLTTLARASGDGRLASMPRVIGGRYGLSSKDFDPAMAKAVFDELAKPSPRNGFTVGIVDDVGGTSLEVDPHFDIESEDVVRALFFGLGADGTVGANKNSVKILAGDGDRYAQGYFVYDSKKSGSYTISHLRFGPRPIRAPYLIRSASFVGVHKFDFLFKMDVLGPAAEGATVLLNSPYPAPETWAALPERAQRQILEKKLRVYVTDASAVAIELGLGSRINTILQTCFFALSGVLPRDEAIARIKEETARTYDRKGAEVIRKNFAAIDGALAGLHELPIVEGARGRALPDVVPATAPEFVRRVTARMLEGRGDAIPVGEMPIDGTYPSGTTQYEKRNIAEEVPVWDPDLCIQCGQCAIVCPHSVIRAKYYDASRLEGAPESFQAAPINARGFPGSRYTLQVYVEDCTGCGVCVENCPSHAVDTPGRRAIHMEPRLDVLERERERISFFETLPWPDRARVNFANVRGVQFLRPLFEFPGACAGCGETPYLKLVSQLFGDRLQIANATGCSSIYGANLPTTPWATDDAGRGPAWSNSLFEDNAEFGLGYRIAIDKQTEIAEGLLRKLASELGDGLVTALLEAPQITESDFRVQRDRVDALKTKLRSLGERPEAKRLLPLADFFVRRSVWIVGGDGWAYDIGYGGLDHVIATGRDVNILVLDTEVYSNTGGQASKATPLGASAKFAAAGKRVPRKDLAMMAIAYGNVYVAQVAMGANNEQAVLAFREAEAYKGPSIVLAYSQCIAHGTDLRQGMKQAARAVATGHWPLFRFDPTMRKQGMNPFRLDSTRPRLALEEYRYREVRFKVLEQTHPAEAEHMMEQAKLAAMERYKSYEDLAARDGSRFLPHWEDI
ncbi:MAG: pyruvate:ferredoxin (flavodoxin) oxidoreductase [Polyangiales bacterium]